MSELGAPHPHSNETLPKVPSGLGIGGRVVWAFLYLLPKNAISRGAGWIASRRLPARLQILEIRAFAKMAGIDLSEAAKPVEAFVSLQSFFTRSLRLGARPLAGDSNTLNSPCDGTWGASGKIENGTLLQVKGRRYRVTDLLGSATASDASDDADAYEGGYFATLYLSPRDYHRLHTPVAGVIRRIAYRPGGLWPVNDIGVLGVDGLFATNERICAYLDPDCGKFGSTGSEESVSPTEIVMVAVGATMVGSVKLSFDDLSTNRGQVAEDRDFGSSAPHFDRGAEWGRFEFGSTIVLLIPPNSFELDVKPVGTPLRLGEAIGHRASRSNVRPSI